MKKFINAVENVESEMLEGLIKAYPESLELLPCGGVVTRKQKKENKVAIVTGGGSGHEPAFAGYVGYGMVDAAAAGAIYTSPSCDHIYESIKATNAGKGVLAIINNYTGDIMNYEMAGELAEADGIPYELLIVQDDVAVSNSLYTVGRRGVAGCVLVLKIAGAKAETDASLAEIKAVAEKAIANVRTMGVAINPSTVPAAGKPGFILDEDEMEVGIGIHGEPGVRKEKIKPANEIVDELLNTILSDMDYTESEVALLVNGSGGTPLMELLIINNHAQEVLKEKGVKVVKTYVGNYMTSIEQEGFSLSLMKLDEEMKSLLVSPAVTAGWKN